MADDISYPIELTVGQKLSLRYECPKFRTRIQENGERE